MFWWWQGAWHIKRLCEKKCVGRWKKVFSAFQRLIWPLTNQFDSRMTPWKWKVQGCADHNYHRISEVLHGICTFCRKDLCWLTQRSRALSNISTQPKNVSFQVEVACIILWKAVLCKKKVWFIHSIHTYISSDFTEDEGNQGDIVEALTPNHLQMAALVCCVSISLFWRFSRP